MICLVGWPSLLVRPSHLQYIDDGRPTIEIYIYLVVYRVRYVCIVSYAYTRVLFAIFPLFMWFSSIGNVLSDYVEDHAAHCRISSIIIILDAQ